MIFAEWIHVSGDIRFTLNQKCTKAHQISKLIIKLNEFTLVNTLWTWFILVFSFCCVTTSCQCVAMVNLHIDLIDMLSKRYNNTTDQQKKSFFNAQLCYVRQRVYEGFALNKFYYCLKKKMWASLVINDENKVIWPHSLQLQHLKLEESQRYTFFSPIKIKLYISNQIEKYKILNSLYSVCFVSSWCHSRLSFPINEFFSLNVDVVIRFEPITQFPKIHVNSYICHTLKILKTGHLKDLNGEFRKIVL